MTRGNVNALVVLAGDCACILLFAVLGSRSHNDGLTADYVLRASGPFLIGWVAAAWGFGLLRQAPGTTTAGIWRRVLEAWLPAWLMGMVLRTLVFGRPVIPAFGAISLVVIGALLCGWRLAGWLLAHRGSPLGP